MKKSKYLYLFLLLVSLVLCLSGCAKTYNITFVYNNGDENTTQEVKKAEEVKLPSPNKEGYDFDDWYTDDKCTTKYVKGSKLESDITLYANWIIKEFDVKFYSEGNLIDSQKVKYNEAATSPASPTKEGNDFKGWDKEFTNVKENLNVNAVYELKKFTVKFMNESTELKSEEVEYGKAATAPEDPKKSGFEFVSWDKDFSNVKANLTVNAVFEAKTFNVKYYDGETELDLSPKSFTYGESFSAPTYSANDYYFVGWYMDSNFELAFDPALVGAEDVNLYALLIKIDYNGGKATWRVDDWDNTNTVTKGLNGVSSLPSEYEKDFYQYLSDTELLNSSELGEGLSVASFEEFSSVNKLHNGDPQRVWNDTVLTKADSTSCGYSSLYLYDSIELDENGVLKDVNGGFLGTEPYKTKYFTLLQQLTVLYNSKYSVDFTTGTPTTRQLFAYVIDGYFYGTQGVSASSKEDFAAFRTAVPNTNKYYTWDGTNAVAHERAYVFTTSTESLALRLAVPFYEGKTFKGWFIDSSCTSALSDDNITNRMTVYAKWE